MIERIVQEESYLIVEGQKKVNICEETGELKLNTKEIKFRNYRRYYEALLHS